MVCQDWKANRGRVTQCVGGGLNRYNDYGSGFGFEIQNNKPGNISVVLQYYGLTVNQAIPPPAVYKDRDRRSREEKYYWAVFEALYKLHPNEKWLLFLVSKDGNCFFHALAALFWVLYPNGTQLHFYHWIRQQICDALEEHVDDASCSACPPMTTLEFYQKQAELRGAPEEVDLRGNSPPVRGTESDRVHQQLVEAYRLKVVDNRRKLRAKYMNEVTRGRQLGEWNTELQILGAAWAFGHVIKIGVYNGLYVNTNLQTYLPVVLDDDKPNLHLFLDNYERHYVAAMPAGFIKDYRAPKLRPKNTKTHDSRGKERLVNQNKKVKR